MVKRTGVGAWVLLAVLMTMGGAMAVPGVPEVGDPAPGFRLADLQGAEVRLEGLRGRGYVVLVFWSTQCHVCHRMIPEFKAFHAATVGRGVTLAAINVGWEDRPEVEAYVREHELPYLVLNDDAAKADLAAAYGILGTPTIAVVDPAGTLVYIAHQLPAREPLLAAARPYAGAKAD